LFFERNKENVVSLDTENIKALLVHDGNIVYEGSFDIHIIENYDVIAYSVMSPQAPDAYRIHKMIKGKLGNKVKTVIGGSHPRYYKNSVLNLDDTLRFDFVVPYDGWQPILDIISNKVKPQMGTSVELASIEKKLTKFPPPSRPPDLMSRYSYTISGLLAFHSVTALGCPFTCNFCESGSEKVRKFSEEMVREDLANIADVQDKMGLQQKAVMFFDDVGLMVPKQSKKLSSYVVEAGFTAWRAFTHAGLIVKYGEDLLRPFYDSGGRRIGVGLETGSQRSLDLINKNNGNKQNVSDHYNAVKIANKMGIAVDTFTMIYPWEDESDLIATTKLVDFVVNNKVEGRDHLGRPLLNYIDSTIMTPYQGTVFNEIFSRGEMPEVKINKNIDPGLLYYKGLNANSGWPYIETKLSKQRYVEEQVYRNSLRPSYR